MLEKIIAYFSKRHLLVNFIFLAVFVGGFFAWQNTSKEELPDITFDRVHISARYPGAPAEDVEYFVTKPIEEAMCGIDGVYRLSSTSSVGASSISDSWYSFAQNVKSIEEYQHLVENNIIPIYRGHILTDEDQIIRKHILNLMCRLETTWYNQDGYFSELEHVLERLKEMELDGLVEIDSDYIKVMEKGRPFIRNICMAFDVLLHRKTPDTRLFSMTI